MIISSCLCFIATVVKQGYPYCVSKEHGQLSCDYTSKDKDSPIFQQQLGANGYVAIGAAHEPLPQSRLNVDWPGLVLTQRNNHILARRKQLITFFSIVYLLPSS